MNEARVYKLKVTLEDIAPPIWRRLLVAGETRLSDLHSLIQISMGWENCHLHSFEAGRTSFGDPSQGMEDCENERKVSIQDVLQRARSKMSYLYDMGDSWSHIIVVEETRPMKPDDELPLCLGGERACPPEDCGGPWGYENLLEAIKDEGHPEHEDMREWVGDDFDPEDFDLEEVNGRFRRMSKKKPKNVKPLKKGNP